jgi:hypothetical protein
MTAMGGVGAAGGPEFAGDMSRITVWRSLQGGGREKLDVDIDDVEAGSGKDVTLQSGDVVEIPASPVRLVPYCAYMAVTKMIGLGAYFPLPF